MAERESFPVYPGWETVRKIDNGSFGAVYEIRRELFGVIEKAALKHISIPQNENDVEELYSCGYDEASVKSHYESYLADIVREYQLMSEMKGHTNVVYCDDIRCSEKKGSLGWDVYIKMELLTPLMKALDQVTEEKQIIRLGKELCGALSLCRSRNIIHRDIKPQNIFLSRDGDFKLGDFGIAKTVEKTAGGTKIGTYSYMAPEVYNNQPYGHEADIYSLGLVLYWLLNDRRLPFFPAPPAVPKASDMDQARFRRFRGDPLPPPAHGSDELKKIVLKACAFDPKDRYGSAEEMLRDLEGLNGVSRDAADVQGNAAAEPEEEVTISALKASPEQKEAPAVGAVRAEAVREESDAEKAAEEEPTVSAFTREKSAVPEQSPAPAPPKKKTGRWAALLLGIAAALLMVFLLLPKGKPADPERAVEESAQTAATTETPTPTERPTETPAVSEIPAETPEPTPLAEEAWDWKLEDGVLTISGTGNMADFTQSDPPWWNEREAVKELVVKEGITGIGDYAFYQCSSLNTVTLPDSLVRIGAHSFGYTGLSAITIPRSVTDIGNYAFGQCFLLSMITVSDDNPSYCSVDGVIFDKDRKTLVCYPWGKREAHYDVPEGVTCIGDGAFYYCPDLRTIALPEGVTSIGSAAFMSSGLNTISLPASVTSIGADAFDYCIKLVIIEVSENNPNYCSLDGVLFSKDRKTLIRYPEMKGRTSYDVPEGVTCIGDGAFYYCPVLRTITLPKSVTSIGSYAFSMCESLQEVYFSGTSKQWTQIKIETGNEELINTVSFLGSRES